MFDKLSPDKFIISTAMSQSSSGTMKDVDEIANKQLNHCKTQICPVKVSKLVHKVTVFSLSNFQIIYPTTRQNIQSHRFISLVSRPSNTTASTPHRMKSQSVWISGSFCYPSGKYKIVLIAAHSWHNIPWQFPGCRNVLLTIEQTIDALSWLLLANYF